MRRLVLTILAIIISQIFAAAYTFKDAAKYYNCPSASLVVTPWLLNEESYCKDIGGINCKKEFKKLYGNIVKEYKAGKCSPSKEVKDIQ